MHWETKKFMTHFIVIFALLQWFGTKPAISLRYAYTSVVLKSGNNHSETV